MQQRLFEITHLLVAKGNVTADELAERFGVSRRTIYRDVDALSSAGVPVYAERGRGGGIRILPDYVLEKSLFSEEEQTQMLASLQSLTTIGAPDADAALEKLAALFGPRDAWLEVDFAPWGDGGEAHVLFRTFQQAILRRQVVQFQYVGAAGSLTKREVEPGRVVFRGQGWYLYGYAREREDWRFFKLSRIHGLEVLQEKYILRPMPEITTNLSFTGKVVSLELHVQAAAAFRVYDEFAPEQVQLLADGGFEINCTFPEEGNWLLGYLLSFGADMEVVKPVYWREKLKTSLAQMVKKYEKDD